MDAHLKSVAVLSFCVAAQCASAQTTVTTSGGTSGTVPVFSGSAAVGNSSITSTGGKVGIAVSSPGVVLDVNAGAANGAQVRTTSSGPDAAISFKNSGSGGREYWWDSGSAGAGIGAGNFSIYDPAAGASRLTVTSSGNIGIGTTTPSQALSVNGNISATSGTGSGGLYFRTAGSSPNTVVSSSLLMEGAFSGNGTAATPWGLNLMSVPWSWGEDQMTYHAGFHDFRTIGGNAAEKDVLNINGGGIVFIPGSGTSIIFADGTVQSTAFSPTLCGGDYAESVNVGGERNRYEPGDVLVIAASSDSDVEKSGEPYSTMVAGVFSTKPGIEGRRQAGAKSPQEVPMAMVGIVPTKVSAENGPIRRGDLLVTSSTAGYAMRGTDRDRMLGAVIGKAMGSLDSGLGVIEALISLQ